MSTNAFLAALPALLAITGFVIYQLVGHQRGAQGITQAIVTKLRNASPAEAAKIEGLPPRQVALGVTPSFFWLLQLIEAHWCLWDVVPHVLIA